MVRGLWGYRVSGLQGLGLGVEATGSPVKRECRAAAIDFCQ